MGCIRLAVIALLPACNATCRQQVYRSNHVGVAVTCWRVLYGLYYKIISEHRWSQRQDIPSHAHERSRVRTGHKQTVLHANTITHPSNERTNRYWAKLGQVNTSTVPHAVNQRRPGPSNNIQEPYTMVRYNVLSTCCKELDKQVW